MSKESYLKAPCTHCNGRISFPASARGMTVACPHCGNQIVLDAGAAVEAAAPASPEPAPAPPEPAPTQPERPRPTPAARPAAAAAAGSVGKPLTAVQQAAIAAARASARSAGTAAGRPGAAQGKKQVVLKPAWTDEEAEAKPQRCDFCGAKIPKGEMRCPDCGTVVLAKAAAPAKTNWFRRIGYSIVFLLAIAAAVQWGRYYVSVRPKLDKDGKPAKEGVELMNHSMQAQPGTGLLFIRGNATNHSDVPYFSVKVEAELLDGKGASLGKVSDTRMVLDAHKLFPFNVAVLDPDAKTYTNLTVSAQR